MSKINFRGKELDVPVGYEFVDVRIPKVGESFINYLGQFENRISDYDWTTGPRPILRKVEIQYYSVSNGESEYGPASTIEEAIKKMPTVNWALRENSKRSWREEWNYLVLSCYDPVLYCVRDTNEKKYNVLFDGEEMIAWSDEDFPDYEWTREFRVPKEGEKFIFFEEDCDNEISVALHGGHYDKYPIMRLKTKPARETFTLEDLVKEKCPREGIVFFINEVKEHETEWFYMPRYIEWAYENMRKHNKSECWFKWFAEHIAPEPKPELKPIMLKPISNDDDVAWTELESELAAIAYNAFLEIAKTGFWGDRSVQNQSLQAKIIETINESFAKHGFKAKGW